MQAARHCQRRARNSPGFSRSQRDRSPVGLCARLRYRETPGWEIADATPAAGILDLMDNTLAARSRTVEALSAFEALSHTARFLNGFRGDADEAARHLLNALAEADQRGSR